MTVSEEDQTGAHELAFTGERYTPSTGGEIRLEHVHRYVFCAPHVHGRVVLDAACGEGYGSAFLARFAARVIGVDVAPEAIHHAQTRYGHMQNLEFRLGNVAALDLPDGSVDVVVSFETIEHLLEQAETLAGFARVLRPDGLLILSSPDKRTYSDETGLRNEFHLKELYRDEFEALVAGHFKNYLLMGQRLAGGSAIFPLPGAAAIQMSAPALFVDEAEMPVERTPRLGDAVYLIAVATNGDVLPVPQPSITLSEEADPLVDLQRIARWASKVHVELQEAQTLARRMQERLEGELAQAHFNAELLVRRHAETLELADRELQRFREEGELRAAERLRESLARCIAAEAAAAALVEETQELTRRIDAQGAIAVNAEAVWMGEKLGTQAANAAALAMQATLNARIQAQQHERDTLRGELIELRTQIEATRTEAAALQNRLRDEHGNELAALTDRLGEEVAAHSMSRDDGQARARGLLAANEALDADLAQARAAMTDLRTRLEAALAARDVLKAALAEARGTIEEAAREQTATALSRDGLRRELGLARATIETATNASLEAVVAKDGLQAELALATASLEDSARENSQLVSSRDALAAELNVARATIETAANASREAVAAKDALQAELAVATTMLEDSARANAQIVSFRDALVAELNVARAAIEAAGRANAETVAARDAYEAELAQAQTSLADSAQTIAGLVAAGQAMEAELATARAALDEAAREKAQIAAANVAASAAASAALRVELADAGAVLKSTRQAHVESLATLDLVRADLAQARARIEQAERSHAAALATANHELAEARRAHQLSQMRWQKQLSDSDALAAKRMAERDRETAARERETADRMIVLAELREQWSAETVRLRDEHAGEAARWTVARTESQEESQWLRQELTAARRALHAAQLGSHRQAESTRTSLLRMQEFCDARQSSWQAAVQTLRGRVQTLAGKVTALQSALTQSPVLAFGMRRSMADGLSQLLQDIQGALKVPMPAEAVASLPATGAGATTVAGLLSLDDDAFIGAAYRAVLHRAPDPDGLQHYLRKLADGQPRLRILADLRLSPEGRQRTVAVAHLDEALLAFKRSRMPLLGRSHARRLQALIGAVDKAGSALLPRTSGATPELAQRLDRLQQSLEDLRHDSSLLADAIPIATALGRASATLGIDAWTCAKEMIQAEAPAFTRLAFALLLGRPPEAQEEQRWQGLLQAGTSRAYLVDMLLDSAQGQARQSRRDGRGETSPAALAQGPGGAAAVLTFGGMPSVPAAASPRVSVIIPAHGQLDYTLRCLRSIARHAPRVASEVIVVDDASQDDTARVLSGVQGLRLLVNTANLGFVGSCNRGAAIARGEFLCFLNNDTEVMAGWLDELVRTFDIFPGTGVAGSRLIYPDGTLQEAGSLLWRDGSAANIGRGDDASLPRYSHAREVDYCSGASLMVPKHLFDALGGFDSRYAPAYCEDSDLAMAVRARGYRVVYQALSVVMHHEGMTAGTDVASGVKAYQVINTAKLFERWRDALGAHAAPGDLVDRRQPLRLLAIEHRLPRPERDAGSVTVFNLLQSAREIGFAVSLAAEADLEEGVSPDPSAVALLQRSGIELLLPPHDVDIASHLARVGDHYDIVLMFRPVVMERYAAVVTRLCPRAKRLYYPHDLHFLRLERQARVSGDRGLARHADARRKVELALMDHADLTLVASRTELELLQREAPGRPATWLQLMVDAFRGPPSPARRSGLLFFGSFLHAPNADALLWLLDEVLPLLDSRVPGLPVRVAGEGVPANLVARAGDRIEFLGHVQDLAAELDRSLLSVAPLRYGAGAKGKVARSLAAGLPVVATPVAVEGMGLDHGQQVLVAADTVAFVDAIVLLHEQPLLWQRLADAGHQFAAAHWGPGAGAVALARIMVAVGVTPAAPVFQARFFREDLFLAE